MPEKNIVADPALVAVDRIVVAVNDLAGAEAAYTRMFGRAASWRRTDRSGGTSHVYFYLDNIGLELAAPLGSGIWGQRLRSFLEEKGEGIRALCLASNDMLATADVLLARGLPVVVMPENEGFDESGRSHHWRHGLVGTRAARDLSLVVAQTYNGRGERDLAPLRDGVSEEAAISALDHVVVMTSDAEACKKLFGDQLGIRLALDHTKPEWGVRQLFFRLGGVTIEVVQSLDATKAPKRDFLWGTAWKTKDIDAVRARLIAEGAEVSEVRKGRAKGTHVATIRPPTGGIPTLLISKTDVVQAAD